MPLAFAKAPEPELRAAFNSSAGRDFGSVLPAGGSQSGTAIPDLVKAPPPFFSPAGRHPHARCAILQISPVHENGNVSCGGA